MPSNIVGIEEGGWQKVHIQEMWCLWNMRLSYYVEYLKSSSSSFFIGLDCIGIFGRYFASLIVLRCRYAQFMFTSHSTTMAVNR